MSSSLCCILKALYGRSSELLLSPSDMVAGAIYTRSTYKRMDVHIDGLSHNPPHT